ncbi:MAG: sulfotransferase [Planctomycetes bacterium]|nr:sulfotransferase [Planctomycetota bacterium]
MKAVQTEQLVPQEHWGLTPWIDAQDHEGEARVRAPAESSISWRERFLTRVGSGVLSGITFGDWLKLLRETGFAVDPPYWPRAAFISLSSLANSAFAWYENKVYGPKLRAVTIPPPLFILGVWRSGTTHLQNLLAVDPRFAYCSFYEAYYPHTFLCTQKLAARSIAALLPKHRPQDNMRLGLDTPDEDEVAACLLTGRSILLSLVFPRLTAHYERYLTFRRATKDEVNQWKAAMVWFLKKLTWKHRRPLVVKSPEHTGRIRLLLELFPDARFLHIHRHPYDVFLSARHTVQRVIQYCQLQHLVLDDLDGTIIRQYKELYEPFFEERSLIPEGRLCEVRFSDLEHDPLGQMRQIYEALDLPDFAAMATALRRYVRSVAAYRRNEYPPLPPALRRRVASEWRRSFEAWDYAANL